MSNPVIGHVAPDPQPHEERVTALPVVRAIIFPSYHLRVIFERCIALGLTQEQA